MDEGLTWRAAGLLAAVPVHRNLLVLSVSRHQELVFLPGGVLLESEEAYPNNDVTSDITTSHINNRSLQFIEARSFAC